MRGMVVFFILSVVLFAYHASAECERGMDSEIVSSESAYRILNSFLKHHRLTRITSGYSTYFGSRCQVRLSELQPNGQFTITVSEVLAFGRYVGRSLKTLQMTFGPSRFFSVAQETQKIESRSHTRLCTATFRASQKLLYFEQIDVAFIEANDFQLYDMGSTTDDRHHIKCEAE